MTLEEAETPSGQKQPFRRERFHVSSYEADSAGFLKLHSLFNYFQEVAGQHATHLGVGYDELQRAGYFWVLSRIRVDILRFPRWGEDVQVETWPKGVERLFALRDFAVTDGEARTVAVATSAWLLLDVGRARPHKLDDMLRNFPIRAGVHAIAELPGKLTPVEGLVARYEHPVMPSDLDVNNHVNNAEYVRWIADCLDPAQARQVRSLQVNYLEEALLGDTISMGAGWAEEGLVRVEGVSRGRGSAVVQANISLAP